MNKKEFIDYTSDKSGVPRYQLKESLEALTEAAADAIEEGEPIALVGFGELTVRQRKGSKGRNPNNGEAIDIPPKKKPYFKPGAMLIRAVEAGADNWPDREDLE